MAYPEDYDPDRLKVAINPHNTKGGRAREWKWSVCEKSKGPIRSGIVTGARQKAVDAGNKVMTELKANARRQL